MKSEIRIGAGSAFCNDSALAVPQLLRQDPPDYIVFEHLSEGLMAPLAVAQQQDPALGWSLPIRDSHVGPHIRELLAAGVRIVTNAGGLNPRGAAVALREAAAKHGLTPRIAIVEGDDLRARVGDFAERGVRDMYDGRAFPAEVTSANCYLGAFPIARALDMGADIVITGRVVDSALTLGPLIHEFGWAPGDHDLLAAGTAAGHLLECGTQATGGTFTDWLDVDFADIGYPIAICRPDGSFDLTKPSGTGGVVTIGSVTEQLLYEVEDPSAYLVPDATCDFGNATVTQIAPDMVRIERVRGRAPTPTYKVCATHRDGWRATAMFPVAGDRAALKAGRMADGIVARTAEVLALRGLAPFAAQQIDVIGGGAGNARFTADVEEAVARIVVLHPDQAGAATFAAESRSAMTICAPGTMVAGPTLVAPVDRLFAFLLDKEEVAISVTLDGESVACPPAAGDGRPADAPLPVAAPALVAPRMRDQGRTVPLSELAWARSGDKGNNFNIAVIARRPEHLPAIRAAIDEAAAAEWLRDWFDDPNVCEVRRYDAPGLNAINLMFYKALRGGQTMGLRLDANAKTMAQRLLNFPVPVAG